MNNASLAIDFVALQEPHAVDPAPLLREREEKLTKIIEAIRGVQQSQDWSTLKTQIFDDLVPSLERDMKNESKKDEPSPLKLTRLAGQLKWAERYADLGKLESVYRLELSNIRKQLYG